MLFSSVKRHFVLESCLKIRTSIDKQGQHLYLRWSWNTTLWAPTLEEDLLSSSKYGFLSSFLGQYCPGLVLGVWVAVKFGGASGHRAVHEGLLEVVEHRRVRLREECDRGTGLPSPTRSPDAMSIICSVKKSLGLAQSREELRFCCRSRVPLA